MNQRHKDIIKRLRAVTVGSSEDMHEPDDQGVTAHVVGNHLDNENGSRIIDDAVIGGWQEFVVVVRQERENLMYDRIRVEQFNLADLLAIVRNVDIESSRCVETLSNVYEILSRFETDDEYDPIVRALNVIRDAQKEKTQE